MRKSILIASVLAIAMANGGCASTSGFNLGGSRNTCVAIAGTLGGLTGLVLANQHEGEFDERVFGTGLGATAGAALGYLLCGEGGRVSIQTAQIRATPRTGDAPLDVALTAEVSPPVAGARYEWDLGDGTRAEGPRVRHTYRTPDSFDVRLIVTDAAGKQSIATTRIDAQQPQVSAQPPAPTRRRIVLRGVGFEFDSAQLSALETAVLDVAVDELKANPQVRVRVVGHTDSKGTEIYNQALSKRRAQAVVAYLTRKGIAAQRLEAVGLGEENPVASNDTDDGRAQNRRVELDILD